jgi:hypothetical protein
MVDGSAEPDVETLAREIGAYVATHLSAADTVESIARWWLSGSQKPSLTRVEAALDLLMIRGLVARFPLPDGRFVYQRTPRGPTDPAPRSAGQRE